MSALHVVLITVALVCSSAQAYAEEPNWGPYEQVLRHYTAQGVKNGVPFTGVAYSALKASGAVNGLAYQIAQFSLVRLESPKERLAFYINAYNILVLKVVLDRWPLERIRDAGSAFHPVWKNPAGKLGGRTVSLDEIEHRVLRRMGDARIHFAIVGACISCSNPRPEPYTAARLDGQLDDQVRRFLRNEAKGLRLGENRIHASKVFARYREDFDRVGGIDAFIRRYRGGLPPQLSIKADLPFDWSLNVAEAVRSRPSIRRGGSEALVAITAPGATALNYRFVEAGNGKPWLSARKQ